MTMDRRTAIKAVTAVAGVIASFSLFKSWYYNRLMGEGHVVELSDFQTLIGDIAETIIPKTDSPGANDAGVANCVVKLIGDCESREAQQSFINWLKRVERDSERKYGQSFSSCNYPQRVSILIRYEHNDEQNSLFRKIRLRVLGMDGMELMKKYTIISYCTSMEGATQALAYDYVPGVYQPCLAMGAGQKCWATN